MTVIRRLALVAFLAGSPAIAAEHHYAPEEDLEAIDVRTIGAARSTIDVAAYVLSDPAVIEALIAAAGRGVVERIVLNDDEMGVSRTVAPLQRRLFGLRNVTILINTDDRPLMHLKAYVVDGRVLRTGSANFSYGGLRRQENELSIDREPAAAAAFATIFDRIWSRLGER